MSIKHYGEGTGHTKKHRFRATRPTREEFKSQILPKLADLNFEARLESIEQICRAALSSAGHTTNERSEAFDQILSAVEFQSHEWFAWQILNKISFIRAIRERADRREESGLLNLTFDLGHLLADWEIKTRMRTTSKSSHPPKKTEDRDEQRRKAYDKAIGRGLSIMRARRAAAKECRCSTKTIERAVKKNSS